MVQLLQSASVTHYHKRCDFFSDDEYAVYVRDYVATGMLVRCCRSLDGVIKGQIGRILNVEQEAGLHDLNLEVLIIIMISSL